MAQADYKAFVDRLIQKYEGGYCWDSGDAGGPTKFGITCYDLAEHRNQRMTSMRAWAPIVKAMQLDEAEAVYAGKYATKDRFNDLKPGADCVMLDYGVNSGTVRPIHVAQTICKLPAGNDFSDKLLSAINDFDTVRFINIMCDERMRFLHSLKIWPRFRGGWTARVADLRAYCLHVAAEPPQAPVEVADISLEPSAKAITHPDMLLDDPYVTHPVFA